MQLFGKHCNSADWKEMERDKMSANDKSPLQTSPSPLHIKRILNAKRQNSESILRVRVSGAEMCNIYRAFHGRLNMSYKRREDIEQGSSSLNFKSSSAYWISF
ncbi:unnamed protein product [Onchocerca ochengi]|uniref:Uncharacterized protein n=1 Tax=Onchocerca ochengi TaxID=42157 RepID=A0A182EIP0_ONCOC|nr:unnamed protein product [Onchocerca ochengi]